MNEIEKRRHFEEFEVGDTFYSEIHRIGVDDIDNFALVSGDFNPIHTDEGYAEETLYGKRIAHGLLILSIVSGLAARLGFTRETTIAFRSLEWKFKNPVFIDDWIKAIFQVVEKREIPMKEGGLIVFKVDVNNHEDKLVQSGRWSMIIKRK